MQKVFHRYPISFRKRNEYSASDMRFMEVVVDVMHTGKNRKGTSFTKEVIEAAIPTIKNTPILGYIVMNDDNEKDFEEHKHIFRHDADGLKYVYGGSAYGVIPETCNPRWVLRDDGDGIEREYLRVDGLLWTKFDEPIEIFARDGEKNHSVELFDMKVNENDPDKPVLQFSFDGCCILSTSDPRILPAMYGSNVTACFTADDISSQIQQRLNEYCALKQAENATNPILEGDAIMEENMTPAVVVEETETVYGEAPAILAADESGAVESGDDIVELVEAEAVEEHVVEVTTEVEPEAESAEEVPAAEATTEEEPIEDPSPAEFSLTHVQLMDEVNHELEKERFVDAWGYEMNLYWMEDIQDGEVIVRGARDWKIYGIPYSMDGDNVVLDYAAMKRKKMQFVDWDEGAAEGDNVVQAMVETLAENFKSDLNVATEKAAQFDEIKPQYDAYVAAEKAAGEKAEKEKRDALFSLMDEKMGDDAEYAALKNNTEMDYSELETKCYALFGRKSAEFSYVPAARNTEAEVQTVRFGVSGAPAFKANEGKYGDLFERYGARK